MSAGTYKPSVVETKVAHRFGLKASLALEGRRVDAAGDAVLQRGSGFHARRCRQCEQPRLIEDVGAAGLISREHELAHAAAALLLLRAVEREFVY